MKRTKISILIIIALATSVVPFALFIVAAPVPAELPDYEPYLEFKGKEVRNLELIDAGPSHGLESSDTMGGNTKIMYWYDDTATDGYTIWLTYFTRAVIGDFCEIWVRSYSDGTFRLDYPSAGDSRNPVIVTMEQLEYLANEFDTNIYPTDTGYFGDEDPHYGWNASLAQDLMSYGYIAPGGSEEYFYDPDGKTMIMVSNIGDESYYDDTYPNYIAGFYWGLYEQDFDRNIINIDAYDFVHRVGYEDPVVCPWFVPGDEKNRPNLYESLICHEYQHLIHADWFPADATFMNEACSLFAEPLCGYELDLGQVEWFLATPDNSLTYWGEQGGYNILSDYGSSFLWALYLTDHYGFDFLQKYVQANWEWDPVLGWIYHDVPTEAKERINYFLPDGVEFNDVFHDWRIANLIHSDICGSDRYNYELDELRAFTGNDNHFIPWDDLQPLEIMEVKGRDKKWTSGVEEFGETLSLEDPPDAPLGWPTGYDTLAPYSTDYIKFKNWKNLYKFTFDGDDTATVPLDAHESWTYDEATGEWYSGHADLKNSIIAAQVPAGSSTLEVLMKWDMEAYWDFGFIQVSNTGAWDDWVSPEIVGVTTDLHDPAAHPDIVANLPGLTGSSGVYVPLTLDISGYSYVGFRYVTDWNTLEEGIYLADVSVDGVNIEGDLAIQYPPFPEADFMVSIVTKYSFWGHEFYTVYDLGLNNDEYGSTYLFDSKWIETTVIVSTINPEGYADYQFKVGKPCRRHWWY